MIYWCDELAQFKSLFGDLEEIDGLYSLKYPSFLSSSLSCKDLVLFLELLHINLIVILENDFLFPFFCIVEGHNGILVLFYFSPSTKRNKGNLFSLPLPPSESLFSPLDKFHALCSFPFNV